MNQLASILPPVQCWNPFEPKYEASNGIRRPDSYRSGAPGEYRMPKDATPHLVVGCVRAERTGELIPALVELWGPVELTPGEYGFSSPRQGRTKPQKHPWMGDWRGRVCQRVKGGFAFTIAHPSPDDNQRRVFVRVSSPGFIPVVLELFPEPWRDITTTEAVLKREAR